MSEGADPGDDYVIVVVALPAFATADQDDVVGQALMSYDPDAHDGAGDAEFTNDPDHAMRFETVAGAHAKWRRQSRKQPLRSDGRPNRPLTAFSIRVMRLSKWLQESQGR